ncbi:MAG: energy-coupling factor transporter transmembrane component T [Bryobacterales bacterium]|nr:energy-coupling factor transporter transmembrane protein EcfT [Bryobacteraceae bacterium]MDW8129335.1 energy-coupling factor transporter transmembrane component T [Bryobacterales bacterium]
MHHVVLDEWGRRPGWLQKRDARVKLVALLGYLIALGTAPPLALPAAAGFGALAAAGVVLGKLPAGAVALRAALVLPIGLFLAAGLLLGGAALRAGDLLVRSYLSAVAVLVVMGTTPMAGLLRAMESLGVPRFLVVVLHFLYRYLFVLSEQAQHMRLAVRSRGLDRAGLRRCPSLWKAAGGALAVLFARSLARAEAIHRAMLARGYRGQVLWLRAARMRPGDWLFLAVALTLCAAVRVVLAHAG